MRVRHGIVVALCLLAGQAGDVRASPPDAAGVEYFERQVRPLLVEHCYRCHGGKESKGGLRLDSREGWQSGGDTGPAIVPGKPDESLLVQAIRYGGDYEMPPTGRLPDAAIGVLERWVRMGAPDPRTAARDAPGPSALDVAAGRRHWAYRPVGDPEPPAVRNESWPASPLDRFILARLEAAGMRASAQAPREVLVRRLYFDLIGLPPTPDQIDLFVQDPAADAYERLVDQLLASPHFGQRWGRHWLDVARFAESLTLRGFILKEAWRYRDYVIESFNGDTPFDEFVREQIAGDLLPAGSLDERQRRRIATAYLVLGNTNLEEQDKKQLEMDVIDEQLDVIGKGLLAQTITCARCHDHKFDPIPTADYYSLAGILKNVKALEHANVSKWIEMPLPLDAERERVHQEHEAAIAALQDRIKVARQQLTANASISAVAAIVAPSSLPGIVVDDQAAKRVGVWQESQYTKRYVGEGYLHDRNEQPGEKTLTFAPELPHDGRYEVRFAYTAGTNRDRNVAVTVFSAEGEKTVYVNEQEPPPIDGHFISLGQYRFERAGQSFVLVSNEGARGHVIADAAQFIPVESLAAAASASPPPGSGDAPAGQAAEVARWEAQLKRLTAAAPYRPAAMSVVEQPAISDIQINIRGSIHHLGPRVPRGFLQVCLTAPAEPLPRDESGRRQLADWIASADNPLTARVVVNRMWYWLFGEGLVRTVDNFGTTGETPSHPELLDFLARRFISAGWSVKAAVREIVLSHSYRQGSLPTSPGGTNPRPEGEPDMNDPENRLLSHMNRRRLDAEALRDTMLLASGRLNLEMGGPSFRSDLASDYGYQHTGERRSVYAPVFRNALPEIFDAFDFADPSVVSGRRNVSTVAPQALFLMNHPFVWQQSFAAAERLVLHVSDDALRVESAFRWTLGRRPSAAEHAAAREFVAAASGRGADPKPAYAQLFQSLFASIDFRYVD
jgi:hypothetical protein